jgi:hypothetical protein
MEMRRVNAMAIDFKPGDQPGTRAEFSYHVTPATITITGKGSISVGKDVEAVLRKIEHWHQAPATKFIQNHWPDRARALCTACGGTAKRQHLFH